MHQPTVAIVILNWNGRKYLEKFLPSVVAGTYREKTVIVADNASTDDSIYFLETQYPQVRIIKLDRNYGFARGYNEALKQVSAEIYVLLNSDVEVSSNWIEPILNVFELYPNAGACQPKILSYGNKEYFEYAGAAGGWIDYLGYPFAKGRIFDICERDNGQYDQTEEVFWASGAALFVRSELFHQVGGLDNYFFAHQEEIDFCWRLQLAGFSVFACPDSVVYHVGGGTLPKGNERKVYLNFRNNLIMLSKNLPASQAFWKLPFRILLDTVSACKSLLAGEAIYFWAVMEAHFGYFRWLIRGRKKSVFPENRSGRLNGWYPKSIVWKHFILGKKSFAEIIPPKK